MIKREVIYQIKTGAYKNVCEKGKAIQNIDLPLSEISTRSMNINPLKLRDVDNLLKKHYGDKWQALDFLRFCKDHIFKPPQEPILADEEYNTMCCDENMCETDQNLII